MTIHIITSPSGRYIYVGSLPVELGDEVSPTRADIMAGRWHRNAEGDTVSVRFPSFHTHDAAVTHATERGFSTSSSTGEARS